MDESEKRLAEKMEFAVDGIWLSHKNSFGLVTKEPASWQVISLWSECLRLMAEREWVKVEDRPPDTERDVLVACVNQPIHIGWKKKDGGWRIQGASATWAETLTVTHWREIVLPTDGGKE